MQDFLAKQHLKDRMISDLRIAEGLSRKLSTEDVVTIVDSGYAVELLCSKKFSRFHHDLDLILICKDTSILSDKLVLDSMSSLVDNICWISLNTAPTWIWLRELEYKQKETPRQINIKIIKLKEYDRSLSEIEVISTNGQEYRIPLVTVNSNLHGGKVSEFLVPDVNWQCATKLRLMEYYTKDYQIRESDKHDFTFLLKHSNFHIDKVVEYLADYYNKKRSIASTTAHSKALGTFLSLLKKHPSISPKNLKILISKTEK